MALENLLERIENKKVIILGFGKEGVSTYRFIRKHFPKMKLVVADGNENLKTDDFAKDKHLKIIKGKFTANAGTLKIMLDRVLELDAKAVAVLFGTDGEKGNIAVACGKDALKLGCHSGKIIKEISALVDGKGGGKPERAMAGIGDVSKITSALEKVDEIVLKNVK